MLKQLASLAAETDSDKRRLLLNKIADLFYDDGHDRIQEREMMLFAEVVTRLLQDIGEDDRASFSSSIAADQRTPRDIVLALANDSAAVAGPILESSSLLKDDDLVAIGSSATMAHRIAISKRHEVTERVTDLLVSFDEAEVMGTLLENRGAALSHASFEQIAAKSHGDATLRRRLSLREDAPEAVVRPLLPYLDAETRAKAERLLANAPQALANLAQDAMPQLARERAERARRRIAIKSMAKKVQTHGLRLDDFVADLVSIRQPLDLALGLSELTGLPERQMANAVLSVDPVPLAMICRALGMSAASYAGAETLRCESMKLSTSVPEATLASYAALTVAEAQRAIRFVKVRATVSAAAG